MSQAVAGNHLQDESVTRVPERESEEAKYEFPGIPVTCDGSEAVVHVETRISQGTGAYPITSSTTMGGGFNAAVQDGRTNLWGDPLIFMEPESEHSSASFCEGFALAGGRVTNFTSGQGLVLMKEVLYTLAGKRLPVVFNIGARALTSHALNVHAGHDDLMSVADCGWGMLFARNAQEAGDLCLISRRAAEASRVPFFNVQDGFLTTHRCEDAETILVGMGSYMETAEATVDFLREKKGVRAGCVTLYCFRPFPMHPLVNALNLCPSRLRRIAGTPARLATGLTDLPEKRKTRMKRKHAA
ncbi:MAG: hypothetical protein ACC628_19475 [Pirellulaceae bacterium]